MKKSFRILTDYIDPKGDNIFLSGITHSDKVPVTIDFNPRTVFCYASIAVKEKEVIATAEIPEYLHSLTPLIAFRVIESKEKDGIRNFTKVRIMEISLSKNPSGDPNIFPISQQEVIKM